MCLDLYTFFGLMEVKSAGSLLRKICEVMFDLSRSICHGAKAPKWVWAESPDHRSHGGGSPPI